MANRLSITMRGETLADKITSDTPPIWNQDTTGTAETANVASNIAGGKYGCIPYQSSVGQTSMLKIGRVNQVLAIDKSGSLSWTDNNAANIIGGVSGQVLYQSGPSITTTTTPGTSGQVLTLNEHKIPTWTDVVASSTINISGGKSGQLPYQVSSGSTSFTNIGTIGQILAINKFGVPDWIDLTNNANNIIGGKAGQVLYQSGANNTTTTSTGLPGQALLLNANGVPEWADIVTANITSANNTSSTSGGTATGLFALKSNTTGVGNDAHGYNSLKSNTIGSNNSSYGYGTLRLNSTGNNNTAVGSVALQANNGSVNTAIGCQALQQNTTGSGNIAISPCDSKGAYTPIFNPITENNRLCLGSTNITHAYVSVPWTTKADQRDQVEIEALSTGLDFISKLKPIKYQFTDSREGINPTGVIRYGFTAQDVLEIDENTPVIDNEDVDNLKINESNLIAILVKAVQELQLEVNQMKQARTRAKTIKTT